MAYSQVPSQNTYSTKMIGLPQEFSNRTGDVNKDIDILNSFFEADKGETPQWFKRAGLTSYFSLLSTNVRGIYYWEDADKVLVATDNDVAIYNSNTGVLISTLNNIFGTTSGNVGFTEFLYDTNVVKVVITDGTTLGTVDSANVWAASADPDLPVPHLPDPLFLDGYLFLVKVGTADIYNSNLNDPLAYTAGDFISCEMFPDTVQKFAKLNNYLVAMGSASIEYFWDAANPSGSPLQRNDTPIKLVGYLGGFAQSANKIYFVGSSSTSTPDVYVLEDFKMDAVGDDTVRRYLESLTSALPTNLGNVASFMGHEFYVMQVGSLTYVMDLKTKKWSRWAYKQTSTFPLTYCVSVKSNTTYTSAAFISGENRLFKFSSNTYQDDGTNFTCRVTTAREMFDTYNRKTMARLVVHADRPTTSALLNISWSDDDYQSFTAPRSVDLNQSLPSLQRLGTFRRRAFKLEFTNNAPLRIIGLEVDINMGQT